MPRSCSIRLNAVEDRPGLDSNAKPLQLRLDVFLDKSGPDWFEVCLRGSTMLPQVLRAQGGVVDKEQAYNAADDVALEKEKETYWIMPE
jgi:hypothetical protein